MHGILQMPSPGKKTKNVTAATLTLTTPAVVTVDAVTIEAADATRVEIAPAVPNKRAKKEKKPIKVVAVVTPQGIEGTFSEPRKPLIVHLPFRSNDVTNEINFTDNQLKYNPEPPPQPVPYEDDGMKLYFQIEKTNEPVSENVPVVATSPVPNLPAVAPTLSVEETYHRTKILACYATKPGELMQLPSSTPVHCYWCSNSFENAPCFLPVKEDTSVYHIYGNFCTPQCGLAYLLNEHLDSHVRWERMALLHRMYRPIGSPGGRLYPAPPRESLISFGGIHTYESFRDIIKKSSVRIDIQKPPMISIIGTLDTKPIDFYDSSLQNTFTQGFSADRFKAWSEQGGALRLKRSKPLKDRDSTLDACINISVIRGESKN